MAVLAPWSYWLVLLVIAASFVVYRTVRDYNLLKQFSGPTSAALSRVWLIRANIGGRLNHQFTAVNDKYGKTARVGPRFLLTTDASLIRRMNAVRSSYTRGTWYYALRLHPTRENIVSVRDEDLHNRLRTQMSFGYSGKYNAVLEQDIDRCIESMFQLIDSKYTSSPVQYRPLDLGRISTFFAMDAISTLAFGRSLGFLDADEDPFGYLQQVHVFLPAIIFFGVYPEIQKVMRLSIMQALMPSATDANGIGKVMGFARDAVAERFGEKKIVRKDMLGSFLSNGLTQEQLESETITQLAAGSDSTAGTIRMAIFLITTNLPVYQTLMHELESTLATKRLTRPILRDLEARTLPYLQACIKETLRCYPPVTGLLAKQSPPEGDYIDGKFIPPNVQIGWNPWGLMRTKEIFGDDAECFRPERWLESGGRSKEEIETMEETVWMVFGYGRYSCLGRNVAMIEVEKAIPELLLRYNFQIANPSKPFDISCIGFFVTTDMWFRVEPRKVKY